MKVQQADSGFILTAVLMLLLISALVGTSFLFAARNSFAVVDRWRSGDECLLGLQAGLEKCKYAVYESYAEANVTNSWDSLETLAHRNDTSVELWTNLYSVTPHVVTTTVVTTSGDVIYHASNYTAEITLTYTATAIHNGIKRKVKELVEYRFEDPTGLGGDGSVFDNVFFIDNVGFFSGVNADFNGDVRANMDIDLKYSSIRLNGDSYAGGENTSKKLYQNLDWSDYGSQSFAGIDFSDRVRPAEYTDYNRSNTNSYWPQGYDEEVTFYDGVEIKAMPFIGPLSDYQEYAVNAGGSAYDSTTSVAAVWGDDPGEDASVYASGNTDGCLVLIGTETDPIHISGIVVATGDIYIKGYYTGQGTLYAGRNIYVLDDLIAVDPPSWPHPDSNPQATATANKTRDFVGLCAKGSLLFGNYLAYDTSLLKEPHTASHATDASDAELGYVSYYSGGVPYFNGDYTEQDGASGTALRADGTARHYFEPTLDDTSMIALGMASEVNWIDGVLYANHLIAGEFSNAVLNGGFVCRDEAIKREGNLVLNWDIRLGSKSYDGVGFAPWLPGMLPRQSTVPHVAKWVEVKP